MGRLQHHPLGSRHGPRHGPRRHVQYLCRPRLGSVPGTDSTRKCGETEGVEARGVYDCKAGAGESGDCVGGGGAAVCDSWVLGDQGVCVLA